MLCPSPAPRPAAHPHKRAVWLFRAHGTLPESCYTTESRIIAKRPFGNLTAWL